MAKKNASIGLVLGTILLLIYPCTAYPSITFKDNTIDNWELLISGNAQQVSIKFCQYFAKIGRKVCTNLVDSSCGCSVVESNKDEAGFTSLLVTCNNQNSPSVSCPEKLSLSVGI